MADMSLQAQFELPLVKDLISENDSLRQTANLEGTKIPDSKIENITVPYIIKNKLLMKEGEFNGVYYPKEEIMAKVEDANEKGLILDHLDTQNQGATAWTGQVLNSHWGNGDDGEGLYGDLSIVDKGTAQKLAQGAKWGISPTIDFEKNEVNGKVIGTDLLWKSFSFVINPAVRDTMLNNKQEVDTMSTEKIEKLEAELAELKKQNISPIKGADAIKEKEEAEMAAAELKELREFKANADTAKKAELVNQLTSNEFLIGRLSEDEIADREKALMEKSTEVLSEIAEIVGDHSELSAYSDFVKAFMKKNKGATPSQAAVAWKKQQPAKGKLEDERAPETQDEEAETPAKPVDTQSLTGTPDSELGRTAAELSKNSGIKIKDIDTGMHAFLATLSNGGAR